MVFSKKSKKQTPPKSFDQCNEMICYLKINLIPSYIGLFQLAFGSAFFGIALTIVYNFTFES